MQDELRLLVELHRHGKRQGPGGDAETRMAIALSGLSPSDDLRIADIGCGSGASTLLLARHLDARVTALDLIPEFLTRLENDAEAAGLAERIETQQASMDALPFAEAALDAIWSEGAIYNLGFETGVAAWRRYLKPGGILAVSELTWLTHERPAELQDYWERAYPEVDTASAKIAILERQGYAPLGYFVLPAYCWLENYYRPLQQRFETFLDANGNTPAAQSVIEEQRREIALYERYSNHFGYGFYVGRNGAG